MKGRIILLALVVLLASVASAAIIKYPVGSAAVGTVVGSDGTAVDGTITGGALSDTYAAGVVIMSTADGALVANSGIADVSAPGAGGELLGYTDAGALEVVTAGSGRPVVGIALGSGLMMINIKDDRAEEVNYEWTETTSFLGGATNPNDVQEAIDLIEAYLTASLGSAFSQTAAAVATTIGAGTNVVLGTLTPAAPGGADAVAIGDDVYVTFEGEFDDQATYNGAEITVELLFNGVALGATKQIFLVDRDFYQKQVVFMGRYHTLTATGDFTVEADGDTDYDGGQFIGGQLTFQRF